ncbi:MAG: DUF1566 domain-containing protein [Methylococcaceae bacterium]|jgi:hypothetical protein
MNRNLLAFFLIFSLPVLADQQICQKDIPSTTPTERFTNNTTDVVTDNKTNLMWKRCGEGQSGSACIGKTKNYTLEQAVDYVKNLNKGAGIEGYTDWRLPTVMELKSLVEEQCVNPSINLQVFPNSTPKAFWSSSPFAGISGYVWYVNFNQGYDNYVNSNYGGNYIRLVRNK